MSPAFSILFHSSFFRSTSPFLVSSAPSCLNWKSRCVSPRLGRCGTIYVSGRLKKRKRKGFLHRRCCPISQFASGGYKGSAGEEKAKQVAVKTERGIAHCRFGLVPLYSRYFGIRFPVSVWWRGARCRSRFLPTRSGDSSRRALILWSVQHPVGHRSVVGIVG